MIFEPNENKEDRTCLLKLKDVSNLIIYLKCKNWLANFNNDICFEEKRKSKTLNRRLIVEILKI